MAYLQTVHSSQKELQAILRRYRTPLTDVECDSPCTGKEQCCKRVSSGNLPHMRQERRGTFGGER